MAALARPYSLPLQVFRQGHPAQRCERWLRSGALCPTSYAQSSCANAHTGMQGGAGVLSGQLATELLSNPLFDDPTLRSTPRLVLGAPMTAAPAAAPQPGPAEGAGASSAAPAERLGLSAQHPHDNALSAASNKLSADPVSAPASAQQAAPGSGSCFTGGGSQSCAGAVGGGQRDGQPAPPLLLTAAAGSVSSLHSRAGSLEQGQAFPAAFLPMTDVAGGPGGLSILYENQAMRMERAELKSELKLISARVS